MTSLLYSCVVRDMIIGKPKLKEFYNSASVADALKVLIELNDIELPVWRPPRKKSSDRFGTSAEKYESPNTKEERFVGILDVLDIISHLASESSLSDPTAALNAPVSEIMTPDHTLLKFVAPGTRLIDALELIKDGTRRFIVPLSSGSQKILKRVSAYKSSYGGWFLPPANLELILSKPEKPLVYCYLTIEDVARFLLSCLGALAPFPLQTVNCLLRRNPPVISSTDPAKKVLQIWRQARGNIQAVAVVEEIADRQVLVGEISSIKFLRCGFRVPLALSTLSAADFVAYLDHFGGITGASNCGRSWSEDIYLASIDHQKNNKGYGSLSFCGRSMPLTCRSSNSVAAVLAQISAYRTTHLWVAEEGGTLVGVVTYSDIIAALTTYQLRWTP